VAAASSDCSLIIIYLSFAFYWPVVFELRWCWRKCSSSYLVLFLSQACFPFLIPLSKSMEAFPNYPNNYSCLFSLCIMLGRRRCWFNHSIFMYLGILPASLYLIQHSACDSLLNRCCMSLACFIACFRLCQWPQVPNSNFSWNLTLTFFHLHSLDFRKLTAPSLYHHL
jgi:hypothetical protein